MRTESATVTGTVSGNTVGAPSTGNSGGTIGIGPDAKGSGTETLAITKNNLCQYNARAGISFSDYLGSPAMNLTITGNTIADPGKSGDWASRLGPAAVGGGGN